jgi:hypothetical protein
MLFVPKWDLSSSRSAFLIALLEPAVSLFSKSSLSAELVFAIFITVLAGIVGIPGRLPLADLAPQMVSHPKRRLT